MIRNSRARRRFGVAALTLSAAVAATVAAVPTAQADDSATLTVVGTSDVFDSNLIQSVIKPGFEAAHPNVTLNYVSKGTGAAITYAESGAASALIVHAASLENQFVDQGYSLESSGRAIFYGDFVLLGPASDPAGVLKNAPHDIVTAFEDIAAAGAAGKANFVSRGGTPGTTVQEHAIWSQTDNAKVQTCAVSAANGGGTTPSTVAGNCPATVPLPSWYHATGLTQGPNVLAGDTCAPADNPGGGCYVFTDRGTFQYLESQKLIHSLSIVTRDNSSTARGGDTILANSFHAYGINPNAPAFQGQTGIAINTTAAKDFLTYITSPAAQAAVGAYLADSPDGAPFLPDAAPAVSTSKVPATVAAGKSITITGNVHNVVPGTPALNGLGVTLKATPSVTGKTITAATGKTDSKGNFKLTYVPVTGATYSVVTSATQKVENATLKPQFMDLLQSATTPRTSKVNVQSSLAFGYSHGVKDRVTGVVRLSPRVNYNTADLRLYAVRLSPAHKPFKYVSTLRIPTGASSKTFSYYLPAGKWRIRLAYIDSKVFKGAFSPIHIVKVT